MKTTRILFALALAFFTSIPAIAASVEELAEPQIVLAPEFPQTAKEQIHQILADEDASYLTGWVINCSTSLNYSGNTYALNDFLANLSACPHTELNIRFKHDLGDASWTLNHTLSPEKCRLEILINPSHPNINLEALRLPKVKTE